jgi:hypothetical protein
MFRLWVLVVSLWFSLPAFAADRGDDANDGVAQQQVPNPMDQIEARRQAEEEARQARLAALEAAQAAKAARVVVLRWPSSDVGHEHDGLIRNVRARIARPDAKFYPEVDLYQVGRREPDRTKSPADQRGAVPPEAIDTVMAAVQDIETVPWNRMTESDWGITANNLRDLAEEIWFVDREDLREPLFLLYVQIGRSAENMNNSVAPFYQYISGNLINYYWYLAGTMAYEDPTLLDKLTDPTLRGSVEYYKDMLTRREIEFMTLSFEDSGVWDARKFAGEYQVFINGREVLIDDPRSLYEVPPGRVDVYLKRTDGHSLSDRVELDKLDGKVYFVRDVARKRMGVDLIDQLMEHPNECSPRIEGDILTYIAIYAKLHPDSEIYFAVPEAGNANKTLLWRWSRENRALVKVLDPSAGFPVRFAALMGAGASFNGANVTVVPPPAPTPDNPNPTAEPPEPEFSPAGLPVSFQFRGHFGRIMGVIGTEFSKSLTGDPWQDEYQVDGNVVEDSTGEVALKEREWNRLIYAGAGVVLMKNAAVGLGPRGFVRAGWFNVPHALDVSLHGGWTTEPPGEEATGRVRVLLDVDGFIGAMIPFETTNRNDGDSSGVVPNFGVIGSAGITF